MSPLSVPHFRAVQAIQQRLDARYADALVIPGGCSVQLDDGSLWEPDVYVVKELPDGKYVAVADVIHVVEVAVSSWAKDTGPKFLGYARNGIPEYWVIDPKPGGAFLRFTDPHFGGYRTVETTPLPDGIKSLPF